MNGTELFGVFVDNVWRHCVNRVDDGLGGVHRRGANTISHSQGGAASNDLCANKQGNEEFHGVRLCNYLKANRYTHDKLIHGHQQAQVEIWRKR